MAMAESQEHRPSTLGELRESGYQVLPVRDDSVPCVVRVRWRDLPPDWQMDCPPARWQLEVASAVPDAELVLLGCGGGGLYTGVTAALAERTQVTPVETELCPHLHVARDAGGPVPHPSAGMAADSLGPPQIGNLSYETAAKHGTTSVLVSEDEVQHAIANPPEREASVPAPRPLENLAGQLLLGRYQIEARIGAGNALRNLLGERIYGRRPDCAHLRACLCGGADGRCGECDSGQSQKLA